MLNESLREALRIEVELRMRVATRPVLRYFRCRVFACLILLAALQMLLSLPSMAEAGNVVPRIPLEVGLMVVSATVDHGLDYEVFRTVVAADDDAVTFVLRRTDPSSGGDTDARAISVTRIVKRQDLAEANRVIAYFHTQDPELFPGSTAFQASTDFLDALRGGGQVPFVFGIAAGPLGLLGARKYYRGNLQRVDLVQVAVLLNGVPTTLPAMHVKGTLKVGDDVGEAEFWWLDQSDNALALRWTFKDSRVQVVRIDTLGSPAEAAVSQLRTALASDLCRAALHGVYFDTGSAALLPQSEAEIAVVAALVKDHPEWQLAIEGHTDDIGSAEDNLLLSQKRAAAVRLALIDGCGIVADRLTATGYGETSPLDDNGSLEGRARNRRVELARQCS